jgi:hypothetical protein
VAAKMALLSAGTIAEVPGSPIPPGDSALSTMWTSMVGASFIRRIWYVSKFDRSTRPPLRVISPYSEVYRSLDLRAHDIRIDDRAAVNRADTTRRTRTLPSFDTSTSATWAI